jgi:hypothetical protein
MKIKTKNILSDSDSIIKTYAINYNYKLFEMAIATYVLPLLITIY